MPELVRFGQEPGDGEWVPTEGKSLEKLQTYPGVKEEAIAILAKCVDPRDESGRRTGLVVGYVQSGKTASFTAVSAAARDNGYQLIIVVAGTSLNLFGQSVDRLHEAFRDQDAGWVHYSSTGNNLDPRQHPAINAVLREWMDPETPAEERRTLLLCVMKQHVHLDNTLSLVNNLNLDGIKALIIDDEADQASLNTKISRQEITAIYRRLVNLRSALPHVTYLQYTATPEAPLLIRLQDMLSPEFVHVLDPGDGYIGGQTFHQDRLGDLVKVIPPTDIVTSTDDGPPESLLEALRTFLLAACACLKTPMNQRGDLNRSMMIHPSQLTRDHGSYRVFVDAALNRWWSAISDSPAPGELEAFRKSFERTHTRLQQTVGATLLPLSELLAQLPRVKGKLLVTEVNRSDRGDPNIRWDVMQFHIVVGGQLLDRGYTVKGLCVTYMPRSGIRGNLDTIHQRARWFGYKEKYLNYCRVWLTEETKEAFELLVRHETQMRSDLKNWKFSLKEWKRRFITAPNYRLTRSQVIGLPTIRGNFSDKWFQQSRPGLVGGLAAHNVGVVNRLISHCESLGGFYLWDENIRLTPIQQHAVCRVVTLRWLLDEFLTEFVPYYSERDASKLIGVQLQLATYLDSLGQGADRELATVVLMSHANGEWRGRRRGGESRLHQGANPRSNYPGDSEIRSITGVTVQIYNMETEDRDASVAPAIAVFVPAEASHHWQVGTE